MEPSAFLVWLIIGILLVLAEFILPGLVSIFLGLGALTVVALLHLGQIHSFPAQMLTFFVSSFVYIFSLRALVVHFYPSDTSKGSVDEDWNDFGTIARVTQAGEECARRDEIFDARAGPSGLVFSHGYAPQLR